jgi:hypothetical protein
VTIPSSPHTRRTNRKRDIRLKFSSNFD